MRHRKTDIRITRPAADYLKRISQIDHFPIIEIPDPVTARVIGKAIKPIDGLIVATKRGGPTYLIAQKKPEIQHLNENEKYSWFRLNPPPSPS